MHLRWIAAVVAIGGLVAACGGGNQATSKGGRIDVVAAENFWGSIASQLAGGKATVRSIIVNPATDPHSYDPTSSDSRTLASAKLAIVNGIGYDNWASQLVKANPLPGRITLDVGDLLGLKDGDNPHQWYSPSHVARVVSAITTDLTRLAPADASYFRHRRTEFVDDALSRYHELIAEIRRRFSGVPVGYSESIFQPLGQALGLKLATPYSFVKAVAEGTEVSASDIETVDRQAQQHEIKVWIFNSQNATPEVAHVNALARAAHIPIATVTETLSPATDSFQQWQVAELLGLEKALHRATGR